MKRVPRKDVPVVALVAVAGVVAEVASDAVAAAVGIAGSCNHHFKKGRRAGAPFLFLELSYIRLHDY
jgi:hypothetical protein